MGQLHARGSYSHGGNCLTALDVSDISKVDEPVAVDDYHRHGADRDRAGRRRVVLFYAEIFPSWISADSTGFIFSRHSRRTTGH